MCSEARKDAVLRKLLRRGDPRGRISAATFYHWRKGARGLGHLPPDADLIAEGRASRDKFAAVLETAGVNEADRAECCRKRGTPRPGLAESLRGCLRLGLGSQPAPLRGAPPAGQAQPLPHRLRPALVLGHHLVRRPGARPVLRLPPDHRHLRPQDRRPGEEG